MLVQPEGDPGDYHQHAAGHVDGDEIVGELSLEDQLHLEAAVLSSVGDDVAVGALVLLQGEARQVEPRHDLHGVHVLPLVHQVVSGPAVCSGTSEGEERLGILTAGYLQDTHLLVQGVEPQVHGTGQGQGDPAVLHSPLHSGLTGGQI